MSIEMDFALVFILASGFDPSYRQHNTTAAMVWLKTSRQRRGRPTSRQAHLLLDKTVSKCRKGIPSSMTRKAAEHPQLGPPWRLAVLRIFHNLAPKNKKIVLATPSARLVYKHYFPSFKSFFLCVFHPRHLISSQGSFSSRISGPFGPPSLWLLCTECAPLSPPWWPLSARHQRSRRSASLSSQTAASQPTAPISDT